MTRQPAAYPAYEWGPRRVPQGPIELAPPLSFVWTRPQRTAMTVPLIDRGLLFLDNEARGTSAFDEGGGQLRWSSEKPCGPGLVHQSLLLTARAGGLMQFLDVDTGKLAASLPTDIRGGSWAVSVGDCVVSGATGREWCYDVVGRRTVWRHPWKTRIGQAGGFGVSERCIVNGVMGGAIRGVSLETGELLWETSVADLAYYVLNLGTTEPGQAQGPFRIFGSTTLFNVEHYVVCLSLESGERRWKWGDTSDAVREGFLYGDRYYVLTKLGRLCVLNAATGAQEESFDLGDEAARAVDRARVTSPLLVSETHVWTGSWQGYVFAFDRRTGQLSWHYLPEGGMTTEIAGNTFVAANSRLYYADGTWRFYCLKETGQS